ncbi:Sulfurtransferase TusA family protein [Hyphomicrobiales bacterium]|nr:Sulfurtransferase TusA family protein [Hyphomicrobiales bacterium]CAH1696989.1 Sulfurtransferase TusA family protein [Hyphomicrobiales bacterium]CAI0344927.1 tRNA 2-thiouridine synthesizing protein A [Hyphomicrobiales bacterium]
MKRAKTIAGWRRIMDTVALDLRGLKCPLPVLHVRKALGKARAGTLLVVHCTDPMAAIDLPNLARETGDAIERQEDADGALVFHIRKAA